MDTLAIEVPSLRSVVGKTLTRQQGERKHGGVFFAGSGSHDLTFSGIEGWTLVQHTGD